MFLIGVFFVIYCSVLLANDDFKIMNQIIRADEGWSGKHVIPYTITAAVGGILFMGIMAIIASCIGCFGAQLEYQAGICTFMLCSAALGMCFLLTLLSVLNFATTLVPIADRQSEQFCNVTQFYTFKDQLSCTFSVNRQPVPCGVDCLNRVNLIQQMGGCNLLEHMCHKYDYKPVGQGLCLVAANYTTLRPPMWRSTPGFSSASCEAACSQRVSCSAYSFNAAQTLCYLVEPANLPPTPNAIGNWSAVGALGIVPTITATEVVSPVTGADGQLGYACTKKDQPAVVNKAAAAAQTFLWLATVASVLSAMSFCCTCSLLYTLGTRRKGRKGAGAVMHKLLCPCCIGSERRKWKDTQFHALDPEEGDE